MEKIKLWLCKLAGEVSGRLSKRQVVSIIKSLELATDRQKGSHLWLRAVKLMLGSVYANPEAIFDDPKSIEERPGIIRGQFGFVAKIESQEFSECVWFVARIGKTFFRPGYIFEMGVDIDGNRVNPVYVYWVSVGGQGENTVLKIASVFQSGREVDNGSSYSTVTEADYRYTGDMAIGLANIFHKLTEVEIPFEVAGVLFPDVWGKVAPKYTC